MPDARQQIGPYRTIRELGRGGMGAVYLAQHTELGYRRAIKILNTAGDKTLIERFRREAQVTGVLDHPNILKAEHYDIDPANSQPYIVMPYIGDDDGPLDLDRYLKDQGGTLDSDETRRLICQILDGLGFAHEQGLVHRDLKPANILLLETVRGAMNAKIADFGLVRVLGDAKFRDRIFTSMHQSRSLGSAPTIAQSPAPDELGASIGEAGSSQGSSARALIGTWSYMAPEQKQPGGEVDHRADLYAVGLIAYRMLVGYLPEGIANAPSIATPGVPCAWDAPVKTMLEHSPDNRYPSTGAAYKDLPGALSGQPRDDSFTPEKTTASNLDDDPATIVEVMSENLRRASEDGVFSGFVLENPAGYTVTHWRDLLHDLERFGYWPVCEEEVQKAIKEEQFRCIPITGEVPQVEDLTRPSHVDVDAELALPPLQDTAGDSAAAVETPPPLGYNRGIGYFDDEIYYGGKWGRRWALVWRVVKIIGKGLGAVILAVWAVIVFVWDLYGGLVDFLFADQRRN